MSHKSQSPYVVGICASGDVAQDVAVAEVTAVPVTAARGEMKADGLHEKAISAFRQLGGVEGDSEPPTLLPDVFMQNSEAVRTSEPQDKYSEPQELTLFASGLFCATCVRNLETSLLKEKEVVAVQAHLAKRKVRLRGYFNGQTAGQVAWQLSPAVAHFGFRLSASWWRLSVKELVFALPCALFLIWLLVLLKGSHFSIFTPSEDMGLFAAFVLGVAASFSSCLAVSGGLALSVGSKYAAEGRRVMPPLYFHAGRLCAFLLLGGLVGKLGAYLQPSPEFSAGLNFIVALAMITMGLSLLDMLPRINFSLSSLLCRWPHLNNFLGHGNFRAMPFVLGAVTFFLPCGFTQTAQMFAAVTGSFTAGAAIMFAFALGTLPVLAALSFMPNLPFRAVNGVFFKTAGLVIIAFATFNIVAALRVAGVLPVSL